MLWLILARALEGVGAGGILAMVMIIIGDIVSLEDRGLYAGYISGVVFSPVLNALMNSGLLQLS
jgi:MFS family permease